MLVHFHIKTYKDGWQHQYSHEYHSNKWSDWELQWIDTMIKQDSMCLTIGDAMFSFKRG